MISARDSIPSGTARPQSTCTTLLLIRHAHTAASDVSLAGRVDVPLSATGRQQLFELRRALRDTPIHAIYSSPLQRARATAEALAAERSLPITVRDDLVEVHFGEWTGKTFADLDRLPEWHLYNRCRSTTQIPGGEHPVAVAERATRAIEAVGRAHPGQTIAVVSHAEIIRSTVLRYLGYSLDLYHHVQIPPASITVVDSKRNRPRVKSIGRSVDSVHAI